MVARRALGPRTRAVADAAAAAAVYRQHLRLKAAVGTTLRAPPGMRLLDSSSRVAAARVAAEGMVRAAAARVVVTARAAAARAAEAEATAMAAEAMLHSKGKLVQPPTNGQITCRSTKNSSPQHVSGNVWARQGCCERVMRLGLYL